MEDSSGKSLGVRVYDPFAEKSVKAKANRTEKQLARRLGGFRQPASGALEGHKGDVVTESLMIDSKETTDASYRLSKQDLIKASREAYGARKTPALVVKFNTMPAGVPREWVVLPLEEFNERRENVRN